MKKHAKKIVTILLVAALLIPTVAMIYSSAADNSYPVELAFNNLFVFEKWATNELSTTIMPRDADDPYGKLETDIEAGSVTITKYKDAPDSFGGIYTAHGMDSENADNNANYYTTDVKPNTTYGFSYTLANSTISNFIVFVFYFDESNKFISLDSSNASDLNGANNWTFTTPANADHIQIRFTVANDTKTTAVSTDVKDIMIYRIETVLGEENLFDFATWSTKSGSGGGLSVYADGTRTVDSDTQSLTLTSNGTTSLVGGCSAVLTNFSLGTYDDTTFTIDTEPGKTYTITYNLVDTTLASTTNLMVLIPWYNSSNSWISDYAQHGSTALGSNSYTFTVPADVYHFQIVFGLYDFSVTNGVYATVKDVEIYETTIIEHKATPHRQVFEYDHANADSNFYGELPVATAPEGYVFGGWYTGENGEGERITAETKIKYNSFTVYPKYERAVNSLEIATLPTKLIYTVGEKLDTTGLSLKATINNEDGTTSSFNINSDFNCTPVYLNTTGTQTITVSYGGKDVSFDVTVRENDSSNIIVNGVAKDVLVVNKNYIIDEETSDFNRYEIAYSTDSYVKGVISFNNGKTEEFFLEPSDNGKFASYVDDFVYDNTYNKILAIKFTCLDNELGNFQLNAVSTENRGGYDKTVYFTNDEYKLGVALEYGGAVSELYDLDDDVTARVYDETAPDGTVTTRTQVDYKAMLDKNYGSDYSEESTSVNLINKLDRGRYLQQSYYGTFEKPYVTSEFNRAKWNYNPVQGGNVAEEASKVVDYEITDTYIYVKARPLDWAKWSDDHATSGECTHLDESGNPLHTEALWGDGYITDTYVEAWYYFEDGMIKVTNRKVDYSGLPEHYTTQEMPALYIVEPLNHFVYNDVTADEAWASSYNELKKEFVNEEEPEFWGIVKEYSEHHYPNPDPDENGDGIYDGYVKSNENWAAFTASENADSFGVGIYSPGVTKLYYGVMPQIYAELPDGNGGYTQSDIQNYRHARTIDPAPEMPTSYIAPVDYMTFKSYDPTSYTYYLTTGTAEDIYSDFRSIGDKEAEAELAKTKIAVPETVYMNPDPDNATLGQYYVNNILDENNYYNVETEAKADETDMYFGIHIDNAASFTVNVTNVTDPSNDIILGNADGTEDREGEVINFDSALNDTFISENGFSLRLTTALETNQTATAKWEITVTFNNGTTETYTAYTVLYAPMRTIGAVAESKRNDNVNNEISSWITGANGVDHSQRSPLGDFKGDIHDSGYFKADPLYNGVPTSGGSYQSCDDYIITTDKTVVDKPGQNETDDYSENAYVLQCATYGEDSTRAQSYLGLLMVDESRYTNTDQIPNLKMGYDFLRVGSEDKNSSDEYNTYYTLGTVSSFEAGATTNGNNMGTKPSGWSTLSSYDRGEASVPSRETKVPSYSVSEIDGKYIHALGWAECRTNLYSRWATAGTSILCSVTDKSGLREAVLSAYNEADENHDDKFAATLENAATVLGTPSATQAEIDAVKKELNEILTVENYSLKYDNLFSAYEFSLKTANMKMVDSIATKENDNNVVYDDKATVKYQNGTLIINSNNTTAEEANVYTHFGPLDTFYNMPITADTEYVFEYDVTSTAGSQAHLFFFDADGNEIPIESYTSVTGASADHNAAGNYLGAYTSGVSNNHVIIRFTAPSDAAEVAFRFGNIFEAVNKSTFSNIRFVEAKHYSEEIVYSRAEDVYEEYDPYGTLMTPSRIGFTFLNWLYDDETTVVAATDLASAHTTIYSDWYEHEYTIVYNANGGTGSVDSTAYNKYTAKVNLADSGFSRDDYILSGWSTDKNATSAEYQLGQTVSRLTPDDKATVTLYAVWVADTVNITFDNFIDIKAWKELTPSNATVSDVTDTGFTLTSTHPDGGEGTFTSPFFAVEPGKDYKIDIDITGAPWDVYIFFCDENGNWIDFADSTNRFSSNGGGAGTNVFTAPNKDTVVKAQIRVDANAPANPVTFNNIRVYEDTGISVSPVNKQVIYGDAFGTLPTPTKEGYTFAGWYHGSTPVTSATTASTRDTYHLKSEWVANEDVLAEDIVVVDFGSPINIAPFSNDTVLVDIAETTEATYKLVGFSTDGGTDYTATLSGDYGEFSISENNVVYTPTEVVNGVEKVVYYYASITFNDTTTTVKNTITVAPASNVLYEESFFSITNTTGNAWTSEGTTKNITQETNSDNDIYGYDVSYKDTSTHSGGSALTVSVDKTNKRSQIASFNFTGTGFELYGACGPTTGIQVVTLKNNDTGKMVKSYIVDTYYGDSNYGTLYQVPVVNESNLEHANYTVQIMSSYLTFAGALNTVSTQSVSDHDDMTAYSASATEALRESLLEVGMDYILEAEDFSVVWFDEDSIFNGGHGAEASNIRTYSTETQADISLLNVIDSFRVYNPIPDDGDNYYIASETGVQYYNVIDNLVYGGAVEGTGSLFAYVSCDENKEITTSNYDKYGSKDELYLSSKTQAVVFTVNGLNSESRVMVSLRAAHGTPTAKFGDAQDEIIGATEMYYDITDYIAEDGTVTIQNITEGTLLSIGSVKVTGISAAVMSTFNLNTAREMMMATSTDVDLNTPTVNDEPLPPESDTENVPSAPESDDAPSAPGENTDEDSDDSADKETLWDKLLNFLICAVKYVIRVVKIAFTGFGLF